MASPTLPQPDNSIADRRTWIGWAIPLAIFAFALIPRLVSINRYITPDELIWVYRSAEFREALTDGRWPDTLVAGHPGVTTTWLGAAGISAQMAFSAEARTNYDWLTSMDALTPDNVEAFERLATFLTSGRVLVALTTSAGIVLAYFLMRLLWGYEVAALAAVLLALDPFVAGLSGLLHVDALSATFALLSVLLLLVALARSHRSSNVWTGWAWYGLSGALAGLAAISKSPLLLLLPLTGLVLLAVLVFERERPFRDRIVAAVAHGLVFAAAFILTCIVAWPALWSSPLNVVEILTSNANRHVDEALRPTFFLGNATFNPGPLFYPVSLTWRLSPIVVLALVPLVGLAWKSRNDSKSGWLPEQLPGFLVLLFWAGLFLLMITLAAKKFDRYALPAIVALIVLASLAWMRWRSSRQVLLILVAVQLVYLLVFFGYPLSAYNPLVGGPWTAVKLLPAGWGEGISAAGRYLSSDVPLETDEAAMAGIAPSLAPFYDGQTLVEGYDRQSAADFLIFTLNGRQVDPDSFAAITFGMELVHTTRYGGLEQAWTYRQNPSGETVEATTIMAQAAEFGGEVWLAEAEAYHDDDRIVLSSRWQYTGSGEGNPHFTVAISLRDEGGTVWSGLETQLLDETHHFPADWNSGLTGAVRTVLETPPAMPPGSYQLALSLINDGNGRTLPARDDGGDFLGVEQVIGAVVVDRPPQPVEVPRIQVDRRVDIPLANADLLFIGNNSLPSAVTSGGKLPLDLFWHAQDELPLALSLVFGLQPTSDGNTIKLPAVELSRLDSGEWRAGETIQEKYALPVPADLEPGDYGLGLEVLDENGLVLGNLQLGPLTVNRLDRAYQLPENIAHPTDIDFEGVVSLLGFDLNRESAEPGEAIDLTLYWQTGPAPGEIYSVFVHLVDPAGNIVAQADHWPGGLPSDLWDVGQVIVDEIAIPVPANVAPGTYSLHTGIYRASDGVRLTAVDRLGAKSILDTERLVLSDEFTISAP